ncbi:MAG TPA: superoxide dismutase family protein [Planctomycetota bacterium]|nr:superoxide dismutase family protein [Planctomycetota bacterium]
MKTRTFALPCLLLLAACTSHDHATEAKHASDKNAMSKPVPATTTGTTAPAMAKDKQPTGAPTRAVAQLTAASDSQVTGMITFTQQPGGVEVHVHIEHLAPGKHGFHIHEMGDCSAHDGMSAGGHFNPDDKPHGDRLALARHAGDLGNVTADGAGVVEIVFTDTQIALSGPHSIIGRSAMVHADPDDGTTQPTGNSGKRIACGVVTAQP